MNKYRAQAKAAQQAQRRKRMCTRKVAFATEAEAQQQGQAAPPSAPVGDGCHCATCTCNPNMTPAVRFDLSPAQTEGAIREHLIRLGWTPPDQPALSQPAAPGGEAAGDWVLVPRTPTDAMLRAAQSAWLDDTLRRTTTMWRAMLAAAPQLSATVINEAAVWRVIAELRAYNPAADEYKGAHIHKVWARELAAALATQHQGDK